MNCADIDSKPRCRQQSEEHVFVNCRTKKTKPRSLHKFYKSENPVSKGIRVKTHSDVHGSVAVGKIDPIRTRWMQTDLSDT